MSNLSLTRRKGETLHVGDDVTITVTELFDRNVRLDNDAPRSVRIDRGEVREAREATADEMVTVALIQRLGVIVISADLARYPNHSTVEITKGEYERILQNEGAYWADQQALRERLKAGA